ncbi:MarR family transcriptional regulator [Nevskia sp.]|uniref:MarR family winged helix-turn-helix transcriptional regulator n=1 Tax=Nevskia sp. TaxID=1929292 RepID=UPI0025DB0306|nr:MarR family transcriptional regulator [Nevskia sp.]
MNDVQDFVMLLRTVPRDWRAAIDRRLAPMGLTQSKWLALLYLSRAEGPPTQTELAKYLDIESPTLVRLLDRLADDGWLVRKACPGDRRARHVHLTDRAKAICGEIEQIVSDVREQLLAGIDVDELRRCAELLRRIHRAAADLELRDAANPMPSSPQPPEPVERQD